MRAEATPKNVRATDAGIAGAVSRAASEPKPTSSVTAAGLIPGGTIMTVNSTPYTPAVLQSAITKAQGGEPMRLQVERYGATADYTLNWRGGLRQPQLVRTASPALLGAILFRHSFWVLVGEAAHSAPAPAELWDGTIYALAKRRTASAACC